MRYAVYAILLLAFSLPAIGPLWWDPRGPDNGLAPSPALTPALAEALREAQEEALDSAREARARVDEWDASVRAMAGASLAGEPAPNPAGPDTSNAALAGWQRVERFRALLARWAEAERATTPARRSQRLGELRRDLDALPPSRGPEVDWLADQLERRADPR
jgi:hypothetical protein